MTNQIESERLTLNAAARRLSVHVSTVWRWYSAGVRGVRLRTHLVGGRRYCTLADLEKFLAMLNAPVHRDALVRGAQRTDVSDELDRRLGVDSEGGGRGQ